VIAQQRTGTNVIERYRGEHGIATTCRPTRSARALVV
jgi:hypothetical protein